jgi:hypothetical protein
MDLPGAQRAISTMSTLLLAVALVVGFWSVSVTIVGNNQYSCGSGFVHSRNTWNVDTQGLAAGPAATTPKSACPSKVYGRRDLAISLGAFALLGFVAAIVLGPPFDPSLRRRSRARSRREPAKTLPVITAKSLRA